MSFIFSRVLPISALALTLSAPLAVAAVIGDPIPPAALPDLGHSAPISALTYAPNGKTVWSVDKTGELLIRSRDGKTTLFRFQLSDEARGLRVLSDGSFLVGQKLGMVLHYGAPQTGKPLDLKRTFEKDAGVQLLSNPSPFYALELGNWALSPDEKTLAIFTLETAREPDGTSKRGKAGQVSAHLRFWDLEREKEPVESVLINQGKPKIGRSLPFNPLLAWRDSQTLVVANEVSTQSFNAQSGAQTAEWTPRADAATPVDPAADEAEQRHRITLLPEAMQDRALRALERRLAQKPDPNAAPDLGELQGLSPDGTFLLASTRAGLQLWNTRDNSVAMLEGTARLRVDEAAFSPDGQWVAARYGGALRSWNIGVNKSFNYFDAPDLTKLAWAPDSAQLAAGNQDAQVQVWRAEMPAAKGKALPTLILPGYFNGWNFLRSAGDTLLAATDNGVAIIEKSGQPRWLETLPIEAPVALPANATFDIKAVAIAPDGKSWVETVGFDSYTGTMSNQGIPRSEVRARDINSGQILWRKSDEDSARFVESLAFTPDGTLLTGKEGAGRSFGPTDESWTGLKALNGATGEPVDLNIEWGEGRNGTGYPSSVDEITVAPGGETAAFANGNDAILADLKTRKRIGYISMNAQDWNGNAAISPGGDWLAGQTYSTFGLYDLRNEDKNYGNQMTIKLDIGEPGRATAVAYAGDGKLALGLRDGRVLVWAPNPQKDAKPAWETVKGRAVNALNWSADGQTLRIGNARGDLQWRDGNSGELQKTLRLLPPTQSGGASNWVQWNAAGIITKSG